jgi:hypothetical protein
MNKHSLTDFLIAHVNIDREIIAEKFVVASSLLKKDYCGITPLTQKVRNIFYNSHRKID